MLAQKRPRTGSTEEPSRKRYATETKIYGDNKPNCHHSHSRNSKRKCKPRHPTSWTPYDHYGMCGQSCPCCRSEVEGPDVMGTCPVCDEKLAVSPIGPSTYMTTVTCDASQLHLS